MSGSLVHDKDCWPEVQLW